MQSRLLTCTAGCQRVVLEAALSPVQSRLLTCTAGWQRVVLDAALSPVQSRLLTCTAGWQRVVLDAALSPVQSRLLTCTAGWQRVVLDAALSPVQSRLLTCAAGVVDAPVSDRSSYVYSSSWGGVYVIAGFTECSRRKLLARADDVRYNNNIYIYITTPRPSCKTRLARSRSPIITRQMLSIVASGSDATVVNGFFHSALVVVRELS